jgi:hypothetical protein
MADRNVRVLVRVRSANTKEYQLDQAVEVVSVRSTWQFVRCLQLNTLKNCIWSDISTFCIRDNTGTDCVQPIALRVYNQQQSYLSEVDHVFPAGASQELVFSYVSGGS